MDEEQINSNQKRPKLSSQKAILLFSLVSVFLGYLIILLGKGDQLLLFLIGPILLAAFKYGRRAFYPMIFISFVVSLVVLFCIFRNPVISIRTLIVTGITLIITCELITNAVNKSRKLELCLKQSEHEHRLLFAETPLPMWLSNEDDDLVISANKAAQAKFNYTKDEFIRLKTTDLIDQEDIPNFIEWQQKNAEDDSEFKILHLKTKTGDLFEAELFFSRIESDNKQVRLFLANDVSERNKALRLLEENQRKLSIAQQIGKIGYWEYQLQTRVMCLSEEACAILGNQPNHCKGGYLILIENVHPDERSKVKLALENSIESGTKFCKACRLLLPTGCLRYVNIEAQWIKDEHNNPKLVGVVQDVTDKRKIEEQFWQAQKMEAIGLLASGVAHDFNNILTVIRGNAELLLSSYELPVQAVNMISQIEQAAEMASNLTRRLLTFSKKAPQKIELVNINALIADTAKILQRSLPETIKLSLHYCEATPYVEADRLMLEQVLMNLVINARDAMPVGGRISIESSIVDADDNDDNDKCKNADSTVRHFVKIVVKDTGVGIPEEAKKHLFEPFFTTKPQDRGTGLGLATSYSIVQQHGGWIDVQSTVGKGSEFRIFLPLANELQNQLQPERPAAKQLANYKKPLDKLTVLAVEDDPTIRGLIKRILDVNKINSFICENGLDALNLWNNNKDKIDVLITDIVMPGGISGIDLLEKIKSEKPWLCAVCISGYNTEFFGSNINLPQNTVFLPKPFGPDALLQAIQESMQSVLG